MKYNRLTVLGEDVNAVKTSRGVYWRVKCDCGTEKTIKATVVRTGVTKSCGCLQKEQARKRAIDRNFKHGHASRGKRSPTYISYRSMMSRCFNENDPFWFRYGGRGITVCARWKESFANFLEDMGIRPTKYSIDRIDNSGNYHKENCKWSTPKEQAANRG